MFNQIVPESFVVKALDDGNNSYYLIELADFKHDIIEPVHVILQVITFPLYAGER